MADSAPQILALFDFDGTLISGDSIVSYLRFARRLKAIPLGEYARVLVQAVRYLCGGMTDAQIKTRALLFWHRLSPDRQNALDRAFAMEFLLPRMYPEGLSCLRHHLQAGHAVIMVSASTENYMRYVADALGIVLLCTPISPDGAIHMNCKGEEKVRRIHAWLNNQSIQADFFASFAYGDSKSDLPMLALCGHPTLVNPKRALLRVAPQMKRAAWGKKSSNYKK